MPSFDALSAAALTPGGVASGLSDLTSALVQAPIQRQQIEMERQRMQNEQQFRQHGMGLEDQKFGFEKEQAGNQMAAAAKAAQERARHNQADEAIRMAEARAKVMGTVTPQMVDNIALQRAEAETGVTRRGTVRTGVNKGIPTPTPEDPFKVNVQLGGSTELPANSQQQAQFKAAFQKHRQMVMQEIQARAANAGLNGGGMSTLSPGAGAAAEDPDAAAAPTDDGAGLGGAVGGAPAAANDGDAAPSDLAPDIGSRAAQFYASRGAPAAAPVAKPAANPMQTVITRLAQSGKLTANDMSAYQKVLASGDQRKIQMANQRLMALSAQPTQPAPLTPQ